MTDLRLTQEAIEQWGVGTPAVQLTQVAVEEWASVATASIQAAVTQVALEQWASVAAASAGTQARVMVLA
jgi:hypothetical protein